MAIDSLFGVSPEALQAQRAAEQRQQAMQFAQLSPAQASQFMAYQAGSGIGGALGGMMGAKDPELEKAAQFKSLIQEIDMEDLDSVRNGINKLNKAGFTQQAMALLPRVDKLSEAQLDRQNKLDVASAKQKDVILELTKSGKYTPASLAKFQKSGDVSDLVMADGTKTDRKTSWQTIGGQRVLVDDQTGETIKIGGAAGKSLEESLGTGLGQMASILGNAFAKKQAEASGGASGKASGEAAADIQRLYDAEAAANVAIKKLDDGIFAGGYGPAQELLAKYKVAGSAQRLKNTQEFRAEVGNLVIPRLKDIGGNDSDNEMKYLREISGGQTDIEPTVLKNLLTNYIKRLKERRQRIEVNQANVGAGKPPETGPMTPVVRKSWNDLK